MRNAVCTCYVSTQDLSSSKWTLERNQKGCRCSFLVNYFQRSNLETYLKQMYHCCILNFFDSLAYKFCYEW